ncbi:MAG TPA: hypothetical protein ENJ93_03510, partial [Chloroflexi bacterium]|nr:hypothetical protein [Chloroflexota bacterium]
TSNTAVTQPGGPTLIVNEGDTVEIVLHNELSEPTSLLIRGQDMMPDLTGVAPGGTKLYSFTASQPGTYLYEAGLLPNAQHQVAMGLYGVLIVRPDPSFASVNGNFDADYANTVLADGPTHYYRLGEAAGPTAFDAVVPGNDGAYGTAVTLPAPGLLANSADTAAGFDGASADSFVDTGVTSMSSGAFSVEAWANANTIGTSGHRIVAKDEVGVTGAWILWFNQGKLRFQVRDSANANWVIAEAPATPPAGTPFHTVGVFDGTDVILYLDGVEVARTALGTATANTNSLPVTIGADSDPLNPRDHIFDGVIDEVALYNYALAPARIQAHFNAGSASSGVTLVDSTANFTAVNYLVGGTLYNNTDGSSCTIASVTATTLTCGAPLAGGAANTWMPGDAYTASGNFAYNNMVSNYDDEAVLLLSEIDPALNNSADPAAFDMRDYKPAYWLINGQVHPYIQQIPTAAGNKVLLRYVNAGFQYHTMSLLGLDQMKIAEDGYPLPFQYSVVAENIMVGQTQDTIVNIPATAPDGSRFALYDASMLLHNNNDAGFGGMITFLTTAAGPAGPDAAGPATSAVTITPSLSDGTTSVFLSATVSDAATGNANIQAAEYYIDDTNGTPVAMTATDGAFDSPVEAVEATIPAATIAALSPGDHLIYVRGQDDAPGNNWGSFNLVTLRLELAGSGP